MLWYRYWKLLAELAISQNNHHEKVSFYFLVSWHLIYNFCGDLSGKSYIELTILNIKYGFTCGKLNSRKHTKLENVLCH